MKSVAKHLSDLRYNKSPKGRATKQRYNQTPKGKANQERIQKRIRVKRVFLKKWKDRPCFDCGQGTHSGLVLEALEYHHLRDKLFQIAAHGPVSKWDALLIELTKCIVVCANCHATRSVATRIFHGNQWTTKR